MLGLQLLEPEAGRPRPVQLANRSTPSSPSDYGPGDGSEDAKGLLSGRNSHYSGRHSRTGRAVAWLCAWIVYSFRARIRVGSRVTTPLAVFALLPVAFVAGIVVLILGIRGAGPAGTMMRSPVRAISTKIDEPFAIGCRVPAVDEPRANAALVVLARNSEVDGVVESMRSFERHFNRWFHYPYVFLNDEEFNQTFRDEVRAITDSEVEFGVIPPEDWSFPPGTNASDVSEALARQGDAGIMYGALESYHHMCRFYSGKFYKHPLLAKYKWYWRVEPDVKYFCDITVDPFIQMERAGKLYGFSIMIKEISSTVPNLFRHTAAYKRSRGIKTTGMWPVFLEDPTEPARLRNAADPDYIHPDAMNGEVYNMCHFWSNFEIASLDFYRSKAYNDYFDYLDATGGFWRERWGDAPVHSLAAALFLEPKQVHYFREIGYRHTTIMHCPANAPGNQLPHVPYHRDTIDVEDDDYWAHPDKPMLNGVGCRCRCDTDIREDEASRGGCINHWVNKTGGWLDD